MAESASDWAIALKKALARWEVTLSPDQLEYFQVYLTELSHWNEKINLTALKEPRHIALGHFADSLAPMIIDKVFENKHAMAIDIGTGAGFPGLPLKVANPLWKVTLVESIGKKCDFLRAVIPGAAEARLESVDRCMYDVTADEDFILDYHPGGRGVLIASGFSGHGFKFGVLVGRLLSTLALDTEPEFPLERFRLTRFAHDATP